MFRRLGMACLLTVLLAACGAPTAQPLSGQSPQPAVPSEATPLEWLQQSPFQPMSGPAPAVLLDDLPQGFNAFEPRSGEAQTPGGLGMRMTEISYERPVGGQVSSEDYITVQLLEYESMEARSEHLQILEEQGYTWTFTDVEGNRVARYHTPSVDGRVWMSGPVMLVIYGGLDTSQTNPWVDAFAALYLQRYPLP
jgi:hypothetical protein